jgi:hypothetical protein
MAAAAPDAPEAAAADGEQPPSPPRLSAGEAGVRRAFGKPAREYRVGQYIIMVWDKNLLLQVSKPGPA